MNNIKNSQGYSLLLSLGLIILFSVLVLSLVTLTTAGIAKNEIRQDSTRSIDQAEKGIDFIIADIQNKLDTFIKSKSGGLTQSEFKAHLINIIQSYYCNSSNLTIDGKTGLGHVRVCIEEDPKLLQDGNNPLKKTVTIRSSGYSGNKEISKVIRSQVEIGANAVPEQLKYTISTNNNGNLYLHGGIDIIGDLKVDGNVIVSKKAHWIQGSSPKWENSSYPLIQNNDGNFRSTIFIKSSNKIYEANTGLFGYEYKCFLFFCDKTGFDYEEHIDYEFNNQSINNKYYSLINNSNVNNIFKGTSPIVVTEEKSREMDQVDITQKLTDASNKSSIPKKNSITDTFKTGMSGVYVTGDVSLNGNKKSLDGIFFIKGNLNIINVSLSTNAIIYVNGSVTINNSTINGTEIKNAQQGKLIIFSNNNINISNISEYSKIDEPSTVLGFFYTKSNFIMYGVGSNIRVKGGISANRTILTAVRGTTTKATNGQLKVDTNQDQKSRLQIEYDKGLIDGFVDLNRDIEEKVKVLADPVYKSRNY
ncbi:hypothetical protein [Psychrobacillus psychrotolerans]|uniref:hypothetical protein n=1 Tax=Psychrobacillus psychrotolerans TaxID=126156 RepID=UPI003B012F25